MEHGKISASMMCADLLHLKEDIALFERMKIDYLHIDVMDGVFVPNLGLGIDYINALRELTQIPLDIHLMTIRPEEKLAWLNLQPKDSVTIQYESTPDVQRVLTLARKYQCNVMLAVNPGTPICSLEELLSYVDGVALLTVNPGFAGQPIVPTSFDKMGRLHNFLQHFGFPSMPVQVDGNINAENAKRLRRLGADLFVAGSSSIFSVRGADNMKNSINILKEAVR